MQILLNLFKKNSEIKMKTYNFISIFLKCFLEFRINKLEESDIIKMNHNKINRSFLVRVYDPVAHHKRPVRL